MLIKIPIIKLFTKTLSFSFKFFSLAIYCDINYFLLLNSIWLYSYINIEVHISRELKDIQISSS